MPPCSLQPQQLADDAGELLRLQGPRMIADRHVEHAVGPEVQGAAHVDVGAQIRGQLGQDLFVGQRDVTIGLEAAEPVRAQPERGIVHVDEGRVRKVGMERDAEEPALVLGVGGDDRERLGEQHPGLQDPDRPEPACSATKMRPSGDTAAAVTLPSSWVRTVSTNPVWLGNVVARPGAPVPRSTNNIQGQAHARRRIALRCDKSRTRSARAAGKLTARDAPGLDQGRYGRYHGKRTRSERDARHPPSCPRWARGARLRAGAGPAACARRGADPSPCRRSYAHRAYLAADVDDAHRSATAAPGHSRPRVFGPGGGGRPGGGGPRTSATPSTG